MRIAFLLLFILAPLLHYCAGSFCGVHDNYREYIWDGTNNTTEITNNTEFQYNLGEVLSNFISYEKDNIEKYGWFGFHIGEEPNEAYAQGRCIGHVDHHTCLGCIQDASAKLQEDCVDGTTSSAIIWFGDHCMMRYSNHYMYNTVVMPNNMIFITNNTLDVSLDPKAFNVARTELFTALAFKARDRPGGYRMFAAGKWYDVSSKKTIYGVAQCSPDLKSDQCGACLDIVSKKLEEDFYGKVGGSIVGPSCNFLYDVKSFIDESLLVLDNLSPPSPPTLISRPQIVASASASSLSPPPLPPVHTPPSAGGGKDDDQLVVYIVVPLVIISIIIFVSIYLSFRKTKHMEPTTEVEIVRNSDEDEFEHSIQSEETLQYDFSTISAATENFSEANKLGQGGFGAVYKGKFQNGDEIAVKRLSQTSGQGEIEFTNEVRILAKLQHRNLVRLLGFCLKKRERLLIYEFVANSSLDNYIFDPIKRAHLNWERLHKIIIGVSRGLLYLHEDSRLRIIHRDLKSSNVLLDDEMTPKIADFGMARLFISNETHGNTSRIVGTYGYMAPEYALYGQFSVKSDVFSFGVLLLEIISGRRNTFFRTEKKVEDLLSYAWKNWEEGTITNLLDPALKSETSSTHEIIRCIHIGLLCIQENDIQRPTMASVFHLLSNISIALPVPSKPGFFQQWSINQGTPLLQDHESRQITNSSGSKNKSSMSWSTDMEFLPR